jgi:hypothetical protein
MNYRIIKFDIDNLIVGRAYTLIPNENIDIWGETIKVNESFDAILLEKYVDELVFVRYCETEDYKYQRFVLLPNMNVDIK